MSEFIPDRDLSSIGETSMAAYAGLTITDGGVCLQRTELPQAVTVAGALNSDTNNFADGSTKQITSVDITDAAIHPMMGDVDKPGHESASPDVKMEDLTPGAEVESDLFQQFEVLKSNKKRIAELFNDDNSGPQSVTAHLIEGSELPSPLPVTGEVVVEEKSSNAVAGGSLFGPQSVTAHLIEGSELPQTITQAGALDTEAAEDKTDNRFEDNHSVTVESSEKELTFYERTMADILSRTTESIDTVIKDPATFDRLFEEWMKNGGGAFPLVPGLSDATDRLIESISKMVKDSQNLENSDVPERTSSDIVLEVKSDVLLQSVEDCESENSDSKVDSSEKELTFYERTMADILSRTTESIDTVIKDPATFDRLFEEWMKNGGGAFPLVPGLSDATDHLIESISKNLLILGGNKSSSTSINIDEGCYKDSFNNSDISSDCFQENHNRIFYNTINTPHSFFDISSQDTALYGTKGFVGGISNMSWTDFESNTSSNYWNARVFLSSDGKRVIDAEKCSSNPNDTLKCWAAADANMLYRTGWFTSETTTEDKVFDCFRDNFSNGNQYGGHQYYGAEWYLTGVYPPLTSSLTGYDMCSSGTGGYFSSSVSESFFSSSCKAYNLIDYGDYFCKQAFIDLSYGRAVSLSIIDSANPNLGHALTLHGITYNFTPGTETTSSYYEIKSIVVSDSDDNRDNTNPEEAPNALKVIPVSIQNGNLLLNPDYYYPTNGSNTIVGYTVLYPAEFSSLLYVDPSLSYISLEQYGATLLNQNVILDERLVVSSAGLAMNTTVSFGGVQTILQNGTALDTVVSSGGRMIISSEGSASSVQIHSGGSMIVSSGAIISGEVKLGGTMIVSGGANGSGATVNYQVKDRTTSDVAMLTNPGYLTSASFAATVSGNESFGSYELADGAPSNYSGSMELYRGSDSLGTLSVGGTISHDYKKYLLKETGSTLSLNIAERRIKSDIDGNRISDVIFHDSNSGIVGYWMNGSNTWRGESGTLLTSQTILGGYDMNSDGYADLLVTSGGTSSVEVGYFGSGTVNPGANNYTSIGSFSITSDTAWNVKVGNLTGNAGKNSVVWHEVSSSSYMLEVWEDGTTGSSTSLTGSFGSGWTLAGCGDFDGDGKDSVLMNYNDGSSLWIVGLNEAPISLGDDINWHNWQVSAIGDFSGDGKDDIVMFHEGIGAFAMIKDGNANIYYDCGSLSNDWKIIGCGDYDGDSRDDLLIQQKSTGILGYYSEGIQDDDHWSTMGNGVNGWNIIA